MSRGLGQGVGGGEGLLHLPPRKWADPGALRPQGSEPSDQPAGRARADLGILSRPLLPRVSLAEYNSRELRPKWGDSPVAGGGSSLHLSPLCPHPSPRLAMDPPRYTLRGGASLSELWAGRGYRPGGAE